VPPGRFLLSVPAATLRLVPSEEDDVAYDETLAERVREALADRPEVTEQMMFGGRALMVPGRLRRRP